MLQRETIIWLLLTSLTFLTYLAGKLNYTGQAMMLLLMASVIIKGHFIIADFMDLRHVKLVWKVAMHSWLIVITSLIAIAYLIGIGTI